jgi:hypothetical protein
MPTPIEDHRDKPMNLAKVKQSVPKTPSREEERLDIPEIDIAAEVSDILANIDQLEQQIIVTNPQNNN